jgi:hypothetical protein
MSHAVRRATSRVSRIITGVGPQSPEVAAAQRDKKQGINDNLSVGLTSGRPIEFTKGYMATRPGRAAIGLFALGAVTVPVASQTDLLSSLANFGVGMVQAVTPERLEPSNYCHNGSGLFGALDFNYTGDDKSAPGDCDYAQTTQTETSESTDQSSGGATVIIPSEIEADPANPTTQTPTDAQGNIPTSEISPALAEVEAKAGASAWSLSRECLGGNASDSIVKEYVNVYFVPINGEVIMAGEVYPCPK